MSLTCSLEYWPRAPLPAFALRHFYPIVNCAEGQGNPCTDTSADLLEVVLLPRPPARP